MGLSPNLALGAGPRLGPLPLPSSLPQTSFSDVWGTGLPWHPTIHLGRIEL